MADDIEVSIADYKAAVKRLTAENRNLREQLRAGAERHKTEVRRLKAQLAEGITPELVALRRQLDQANERADSAEQRLRENRRHIGVR